MKKRKVISLILCIVIIGAISTNFVNAGGAKIKPIITDSGFFKSYISVKSKKIGNEYKKTFFEKYLSGSWANSEKYTWNETNTSNWSISGGGSAKIKEAVGLDLGLSYGKSYSYAINTFVQSNPKKLSRLGFFVTKNCGSALATKTTINYFGFIKMNKKRCECDLYFSVSQNNNKWKIKIVACTELGQIVKTFISKKVRNSKDQFQISA